MSANKIEITLPDPDWFRRCNAVYTGSAGTSPQKGFMNREIFEYKAERPEGTEILVVTCRTRPPWNTQENPGKSHSRAFMLDEEGIRLAKMWLEVPAHYIFLRVWD